MSEAEEKWAQFRDTRYQVSDQGRVRGADGRLKKPTVTHFGHLRVSLRVLGKATTTGVHRLVASAFIPNPEGLPFVDHIDRNPKNNRVENLRWSTCAENNRNHTIVPFSGGGVRRVDQLTLGGLFLRTWNSASEAERTVKCCRGSVWACCSGKHHSAGGYKWAYHDESKASEVWKASAYPDIGNDVEVSNFGRVRCKERITQGTRAGAYRTYRGAFVHRLVAHAFCARPEGCDVVDHLDSNPSNNAAANLEWVTQTENVRRAHAAGLTKHKRGKGAPVEVNADSGPQRFPSAATAARHYGCTPSLISMACTGKCKTALGMVWRYIPEEELEAAGFGQQNPAPPGPGAQPSAAPLAILNDDPVWAELGFEEAAPLTVPLGPGAFMSAAPSGVIPDDDPLWAEYGL